MSERAVRIIPPTMNMVTHLPKTSTRKRRVAAYARVSTDSEEQLTSYEAQVSYYTDYINKRNDWEFVSVYADEGVSGCNTAKREGFNRMIKDALDGKIDLIVTKSVSRFARNTVDSLTTVRKLKEKGIEVYFEKENIYTLDSKGELLITIMSSLAQEESRSISENVTWGQRKRFADGKVYHSITLSKVTMRSFHQMNLNWFRRKFCVENLWESSITARAFLRRESYAVTVETFMVQKYGIPHQNIAV